MGHGTAAQRPQLQPWSTHCMCLCCFTFTDTCCPAAVHDLVQHAVSPCPQPSVCITCCGSCCGCGHGCGSHLCPVLSPWTACSPAHQQRGACCCGLLHRGAAAACPSPCRLHPCCPGPCPVPPCGAAQRFYHRSWLHLCLCFYLCLCPTALHPAAAAAAGLQLHLWREAEEGHTLLLLHALLVPVVVVVVAAAAALLVGSGFCCGLCSCSCCGFDAASRTAVG